MAERTGLSPCRMLTVEESLAGQADWEASVTRSAERYRELRRCWNCGARWNEAGECPTKGCRGPGSGFEKRPGPHAERPCVGCGTLTSARAIGGIILDPKRRDVDDFGLESWAWCDRCEQRRTLAQARAIVANPDVYPHIRERCAALVIQLEQELHGKAA